MPRNPLSTDAKEPLRAPPPPPPKKPVRIEWGAPAHPVPLAEIIALRLSMPPGVPVEDYPWKGA